MSFKGKINQYTCNLCGKRITTIDLHQGTTPFMLRCRATERCPGTMRSAMYQVNQLLKPDHEWYKPAGKVKAVDREHVEMGGLLLRKVES